MITVAEVRVWGRTIGAVSLEEGDDVAAFQYDREFAGSGIEVSPLTMPLSERIYTFTHRHEPSPTCPRPRFPPR